MSAILVETVLPSMTGILADSVVNTSVWLSPAPTYTQSDLTDIGVFLVSFYNNQQAIGNSIANLLGSQLDRTANKALFKMYDISDAMDGSPHGSPIKVTAWTLGASQVGETNLPSEVSIVLSYHALLTDIPQEGPGGVRPAQRHRGRMYLGPLNTLA